MRRVPTHLPGMLTREEFVGRYCERMGLSVTPEQWRFYEVFGLFRLAVIAQQIYYRFARGETTSRRAAALGGFVPVLIAAVADRISGAP
jgi:aminoglycoside phosphotransferase (APT) family kinase protein